MATPNHYLQVFERIVDCCGQIELYNRYSRKMLIFIQIGLFLSTHTDCTCLFFAGVTSHSIVDQNLLRFVPHLMKQRLSNILH